MAIVTRWKTHFDCTVEVPMGTLVATLCGQRKAWQASRTDDVDAVTCGRCRRQLTHEGQYTPEAYAARHADRVTRLQDAIGAVIAKGTTESDTRDFLQREDDYLHRGRAR